MAVPLALYVLGPFEVRRGGELLGDLPFAKERALLAYLAVESQRAHARETLAELFWPGRPDGVARNNLRQALFHLRRRLGDQDAQTPLLCVSADSVQVCGATQHWLDAAAFEADIRAVRQHRHLSARACPDCLQRLRAAAALYRGEFLEGLCLKDCREIQGWIEVQREQLRHRQIEVLQQLSEALRQRARHEEARDYARRWVRMDPLDECGARQLMLLLALQGRRVEALNHYEALCHALSTELGVGPSEETEALYHQIAAGALQAEPDALLPAPGQTAVPFVARERELAALESHLAAALAGDGRAIFISGDAGSGKTRLAAEFARRALAARSDLLVASGNCNAQAGLGDPYLPFVEVLQALTADAAGESAGGAARSLPASQPGAAGPEAAQRAWDAFPVVARALFAHGAGLLGHFKPGEAWAARLDARAQARLAGGEPSTPRRQPLEQDALMDQLSAVLHAIARVHPLLIVLEDLHWADAGSISLLFHLGRRLAGWRILVIGTYRPHDLAPSPQGTRHPLVPVVHELERTEGEILVDLDAAAGRDFVDALVGAVAYDLDADFRETLARHTGGHALFTVELLRGMQARGDLLQVDGRWRKGVSLDWERIPTRVEAVIAERLASLPAEWRATLAVAAVEGEQFTAEVAARVQGIDSREILAQLNEGLDRQYGLISAEGLQRSGQALPLSRYAFRHSLFQRYLYMQLNAVERARLHEAVGRAIGELYAAQAHHEAAALLAWHFESAGMAHQAASYLLDAGRRAVRLSAGEQAIALLERGICLLAALPAGEASPERLRLELDLHLALAAPLLQVRGWGASQRETVFARAGDLARQLGETARLFQALLLQADQMRNRGRLCEALSLSEELLAMAHASQDPVQRALAYWSVGLCRLFLGDLVQAREDLLAANAIYDAELHAPVRAILGFDLQVALYAWLALLSLSLGRIDECRREGEAGVSLARRLKHAPSLAVALTIGRVVVLLLARDYLAARDALAELQPLADDRGMPDFRAWGALLAGYLQAALGRPAEGLLTMEAANAWWRAAGSLAGSPLQMLLLAEACLWAGQPQRALEFADEGLAISGECGMHMTEAELLRLHAAALSAQAAAPAEVEAYLARALASAQAQSAHFMELRAALALYAHLVGQGEQAAARGAAALARACAAFGEDTQLPDLQAARALLQAQPA